MVIISRTVMLLRITIFTTNEYQNKYEGILNGEKNEVVGNGNDTKFKFVGLNQQKKNGQKYTFTFYEASLLPHPFPPSDRQPNPHTQWLFGN